MGSLIDMPVSLCYPQYLSSVIQRSPPHQVSRDIVEPDIDGLRVLNSVADSVLMSQGAASSLCSIYTVVCKKHLQVHTYSLLWELAGHELMKAH